MSLLVLTLLRGALLIFSFTSCAHKSLNPCEQHLKTSQAEFPAKILDFYSTREPYGEFSNFSPFPVFVDNEWWPTSEHYYQAQKYDSPKHVQWVKSAPSPMEAAKRGRDPTIPKRKDWDLIKDQVMEKAVSDKFQRHSCLRELLLATGEAKIYEHTQNDCYWGDCGDRSGKNKLGLLLEKIRRDLKEKAN